ncbi:hypothetical protein BOTBODRAFT_173383 [Botryobasidium botryosum FD-172 SS1]|uniref:Uncharacterized protein n=1 Tax=Botryobasidium botryosum (strain FD-172 SS1) TaxID=930990 RepID=A0A067MN04_BOTB1|nr:hypothetical protein BOTBODRAFT_173383 [Botryobasidium botryosum FD-172 SS1]
MPAFEVPPNNSLEETVPLDLNAPFPVYAPNEMSDEDHESIRSHQTRWLNGIMSTLRGVPTYIKHLETGILTPNCAVITRLLLSAAQAMAMNDTQLLDAIRDIPPLMEGAIAKIIVESMAHIEALAKRALSNKTEPKDKGKGKTPAPGPSALGVTPPPPTASTPDAVTITTQIQPAQSYAAAANKGKNKVRDPLESGEPLFAPLSTTTRDGNAARINGQNAVNLINKALGLLTPTCTIKGIRWTQRDNILLTPSSPEEWDILTKHSPGILEHLCQVKFTLRTPVPSKDLVLHGWPAKHGALPNVENICTTVATAAGIDANDIIKEKCRWLVGPKSNTSRPPLLLLTVATDEAESKLLFHNPHWINGKKITFKKFSTPPTVPSQCTRCWKVGHPTWRCSAKVGVCALCSGEHLTPDHSCSTQGCKVKGKRCAHTLLQCPICTQDHPAWDKDCQECQIQKAANPPKKKQASPKAASAPADSPTRKVALLICAIPANCPGHPGRDISKITDLDLVKKFCLWAVYNELPVITFSPEGEANWSNIPTGPTKTTFLPPLNPSPNGS